MIVCASVGQAFTTHLGNKLRRLHHLVTRAGAGRDGRRAGQRPGDAARRLADRLRPGRHVAADAGQGGPQLQGAARASRGCCRPRPTPGSRTSPRSSRRTASRRSSRRSPTSRSPRRRRPTRRWPSSPVAARPSAAIVKVVGTAPSCGKVLEGTGFVFADHRVMTNAHVVGGVDEPTVQIGGEGRLYDAQGRPLRLGARHRRPRRARPRRPALEFADEGRAAAATAPSSRASRRTAPSTSAPRASGAASTPTARTSTTGAPSAATSTRSTRPSGRATPAARCSPRTARSTA